MSYIESRPIEAMIDASQEVRNHIVRTLMSLTLRELFTFKLMQTDPNFANYKYNDVTGQIVLLDFGATREIEEVLSTAYRKLMETTLSQDTDAIYSHIVRMRLIPENLPEKYARIIRDMIAMAIEPMGRDEPFDFAESSLAKDLRDEGLDLATKRELWHVPPPETVFIQRKLGGMYLLATRLRAKINVAEIIRAHLSE